MGISGRKKQGIFVAPLAPVPARCDYNAGVIGALEQRRILLDSALGSLMERAGNIGAIAGRLVKALSTGHKVLIAGNGGSAAQAQHFAAELVGRFKRERSPYAALALTTDTSILTAIGNDYGYEDIFARQIRALGQPGDLFIALSTSGESENLVRAATAAQQYLITVVAMVGERACRLGKVADIALQTPIADTAIAQELHMLIIHVLCDIAEGQLAACEGEASL
ncbi:MAG TPA: SIS domain-containing protein [Ktedonobacteraceae bacterium]|jgi:D-sedoheptulose 7-phosphate isomerase|nr:SIS domain-containing protein [Ktedonobacteraceae bacterium]